MFDPSFSIKAGSISVNLTKWILPFSPTKSVASLGTVILASGISFTVTTQTGAVIAGTDISFTVFSLLAETTYVPGVSNTISVFPLSSVI